MQVYACPVKIKHTILYTYISSISQIEQELALEESFEKL
jgi:hypothetical protein